MKTYQTKIVPSAHELFTVLSEQLPGKFDDKIKGKAPLYVVEDGNSIEVGLSEAYEQYLYRIQVIGSNVSISKSEHYTDDVNSLALEDILTDAVIDFIGKANIVDLEPSAGN